MHQRTLCFAASPKKSQGETKVDPVVCQPPSAVAADYDRLFMSATDFANCLDPSWRTVLEPEFKKPYFSTLLTRLQQETREVFPPRNDILNAFNLCPFDKVKVVIIGQDPYHDDRQAHGLCFSVRRGIAIPPSLHNIYKELTAEYPDTFHPPKHGCLEAWAKQGVLLLNAGLTVAAHQANSHKEFGWANFTGAAIAAINAKLAGIVFIAWGNFAQKICAGVSTTKHTLLKSGHPSPLSQKAFFGNGHFKEVNRILAKKGQTPINWNAIND
jgi:uracil-DNA glycosylase